MEELSLLLLRVSQGDDVAINLILENFNSQHISTNEQEQIHVYLKNAPRENHHAIYFRGLLYELGLGVKIDLEMAFLLMREAASKGNGKATFVVGKYFLEGKGTVQNYQAALQWLTIAAESPNYLPGAMFELGRLHEEGLGIPQDLIKAQEWYQKAAKKGHKDATKKIK